MTLFTNAVIGAIAGLAGAEGGVLGAPWQVWAATLHVIEPQQCAFMEQYPPAALHTTVAGFDTGETEQASCGSHASTWRRILSLTLQPFARQL
jgi:hypothetical protein